MSEENKALVRRFYDEVWNKGNLDAAYDVFATTTCVTTCVPETPPQAPRDRSSSRGCSAPPSPTLT